MKLTWLLPLLLVYPCIAIAEEAPRDCGVTLKIIEQRLDPVIKNGDPGTESNKYGFEGGCVLKWKGVYHLFTSEMAGDPKWVKMRLGHWLSKDRFTGTATTRCIPAAEIPQAMTHAPAFGPRCRSTTNRRSCGTSFMWRTEAL